MKNVEKKALKRTITLLAAMGCQFKVIDPDGGEHGDLQVVKPKTTDRKKRNDFRSNGYVDLIKKQKVGEVIEFTAPDEAEIVSFRSAIAGRACQIHGKGSYTTCINNGIVEGLRVG